MADRTSQFDGSIFDELLKTPTSEAEEEPEPNELGPYIRGRRELIGAGLRQFARAIDCAPATMSQIENGNLTPGYDLAVKIAVTLHVNGAPTSTDKVLLMSGHIPKGCRPETVEECEAIKKVLKIMRGSDE